jgi:glycosyltransferase involved in cell wall biosynthesis
VRLLHVITSLNRGGAENHLADLARAQVRRGAQVAVAYLKGDGAWGPELSVAGVAVHSLGLSRYGAPGPVLRLRRLIGAFDPALVHAHMPPAELYSSAALLGRSTPFVISKHNDERFAPVAGHRRLARWTAARAGRILCISEAVARYMAGGSPGPSLPADKLAVVHYGLDPAAYAAATGSGAAVRASLGIPPGALVIGSIARLAPQKGLDTLLAAFAALRTEIAQPARLLLVGQGPLEAELRAQAIGLGIAEATVFAGFRRDIPAVLDAFDIFALTSRWEGFGLVLLEAMAASLPIVATRVSAIPEVVGEGADAAGLLVPPDDAAAAAAALRGYADMAARRRAGKAGYARLCRRFSLERMVDLTEAVYREALAAA